MRKVLLISSLLFIFLPSARAQVYTGCNSAVPFVVGPITVQQCNSEISNTSGQSFAQINGSAVSLPVVAGDSAVLFGYQCYPAASTCGTPTSISYLFPSSTSGSYTPITGVTPLYQAILQNPSFTQAAATPCFQTGVYCNYVWYFPTVPTLTQVYVLCSSTPPPTFTSASGCAQLSLFYIEFSSGCTLSGSGCLDQPANNSTDGTATSVQTVNPLNFTNEFCIALGGTINDEVLSPTNGGTVIAFGYTTQTNPIYGKACNATAFSHAQSSCKFGNGSTGATSISCTLGANPGTGDTVLVGIGSTNFNTGGVTCSDANSNSYTKSPNSDVNGAGGVGIFYLLSAPSNASKTVTCSWSGSSTFDSIVVDDFTVSGGNAVFDFDKPCGSGANCTGSGTNLNLPSLSVSSGELLYCIASPGAGISAPAGGATLNGWTGSGIDSGQSGNAVEYIASSASGAKACSFTDTASGDTYTSLGGAFKISASTVKPSLGQQWTNPADKGGMIMVTLQSSSSIPLAIVNSLGGISVLGGKAVVQ